MTNCIGFVNLTTGASDRGPVTLVSNAPSYKPQQHLFCDASNVEQSSFSPLRSDVMLIPVQISVKRGTDQLLSDQMRWEKSQGVHYGSSSVSWKWRRHTDLLRFSVCDRQCYWSSRGMSADSQDEELHKHFNSETCFKGTARPKIKEYIFSLLPWVLSNQLDCFVESCQVL